MFQSPVSSYRNWDLPEVLYDILISDGLSNNVQFFISPAVSTNANVRDVRNDPRITLAVKKFFPERRVDAKSESLMSSCFTRF